MRNLGTRAKRSGPRCSDGTGHRRLDLRAAFFATYPVCITVPGYDYIDRAHLSSTRKGSYKCARRGFLYCASAFSLSLLPSSPSHPNAAVRSASRASPNFASHGIRERQISLSDAGFPAIRRSGIPRDAKFGDAREVERTAAFGWDGT